MLFRSIYSCTECVNDTTKALYWYNRAAEQGDSETQIFLGDLYYKSDIVEQNYETAFDWYMKAAIQKDKYAEFAVANCYVEGKGVEKNIDEAKKWYSKSAKHGYKPAKKELKE